MKQYFINILMVSLVLLTSCKDDSKNTIHSPDQNIQVNVEVNKAGQPIYSVIFNGEKLITNAALGLKINGIDLSSGVQMKKVSISTVKDKWEPVWGQYAEINNYYNQGIISLEKDNLQIDVTFRVYNDGLGFRYTIQGEGEAIVNSEATQFNMASDNKTWWIAPCWENDEYIYQTTLLSEITEELRNQSAPEGHAQYFPCATGFNTPVTMKTPAGNYLSIHEAALVNYPGSSLCLNPENLEINMAAAGKPGEIAKVNLPFSTPWRTITVGKKAGDLIESSLILNLNEPNKLEDVSFIKPMKYVGIWWEMHVKKSTWELEGSKNHGANTANVKRYIDFAAENGFGGVLVEGWNKGWNGWVNFDYTQPYADFDMDELSAYAQSKGIEIIGHHETGGQVENYERQLEDAYQYYQDHGVHAVKTGYVGKIENHYHYDQWMVNHYNHTVKLAAQHQIAVNTHEPIKPSGLSRTYPNLLSGEGMRGQEFNAWSDGTTLNHHTILPFTRNLAGPMDYTPGIFDLQLVNSVNKDYKKLKTDEERKNYPFKHRVKSTLAHQLGLYVVFYSPIQMAADLPENYAGIDALQFIKDVPVDWSDTKVLDAEIGEFCTIARKDKQSDNWFVGGITNQDAREETISFDFLDDDASYECTLYSDDAKADWDLNPTLYNITKKEIKKGDSIQIKLAPGGGFAISLIKK
ncbi:glycoside hydrolase family 97 protein [Carboxylicivirga caseinilyticus]|uniref:glycoside hydrolase family 97 protein n=1 Tax=Carboxylicivirga caseinilyticus TaxID=3417572 RepID=UPI003D33DA9E|nr:glycoside hydrolase family 97 protein [Marinilabiliaceae bacterium A049]